MITTEQHQKYLDTENLYRNKMTGRERTDAWESFYKQWVDPNPDSIMCESNYNEFIWWLSKFKP